MLKQWIQLVIDVDYHPCDPGSTRWYRERTVYEKSDLQAGMPLRYRDPGDLFGAIRLLDVSEDGVVLEYDGEKYGLNLESPYGILDEAGRDYTEFELIIRLVSDNADEDAEDEVEEDEEADEAFEDDDGRWDAYV